MKIRRRLAAILSAVMVLSSLQWSAVPVLASEEVTADETVVAMDEVTAGQEEVTADDEAVSAGFDDEVSVDADSNGVTADDEITAGDDILRTDETQDKDMAGSSDNDNNEDIDLDNNAGSGQENQPAEQKNQADPQQKGAVNPAVEEDAPADKPLTGNIKKNGTILIGNNNDPNKGLGVIYQNNDGTISGNYINVYWDIDKDGLLTVTGTGEFRDGTGKAPWCDDSFVYRIKEAKVTLTGAKSLSHMFDGCWNLAKIDLTGLDSSNVEDMSYMFNGCKMTEMDLSNLNLSNVKSFNSMFWQCTYLRTVTFGNGTIGSGDPDYLDMFSACPNLTEIDIQNFSKGSYFGMLSVSGISKITVPELSKGEEIPLQESTTWKNETSQKTLSDNKIVGPVAKGTLFTRAGAGGIHNYYGADIEWSLDDKGLLTATIDGDMRSPEGNPTWDPYQSPYSWPWGDFRGSIKSADIKVTENTTRLGNMLANSANMTSFTFNTASNISNVTDMQEMLWGCESLKNIDFKGLNLSNVKDMRSMFYGCTNLQSVNFSGTNLGSVTDLRWMLNGCTNLQSVNFSGTNLGSVTYINYMLGGCTSLQSVNFSGTNLGSVTDMQEMFWGCESLKNIDFKGLDLSNVKDMRSMFYGCPNLQSVNFSGTKLGSVTDMSYMFYDCTNLASINLKGLDLSKVTSMRSMFCNCTNLRSIDLSGLDLSKVTDMSCMFYGCTGLTSANLSGLTLDSVTNAECIFTGCKKLANINLSKTTLSKVENIGAMFEDCPIKSIDLSGLDLTYVTDMHALFERCSQLTKVELKKGNSVSTTPVSILCMFEGCSKLQTIDLTGITQPITVVYNGYGDGVFHGCDSLQYIALNKNLKIITTPVLTAGGSSLSKYSWVSNACWDELDSVDSDSWDPDKLKDLDKVEYYRQTATGVTPSAKSINLKQGGTYPLTVTTTYSVLAGGNKVSPAVIPDSVEWTISDPTVISDVQYQASKINGNKVVSTYNVIAGLSKEGSSTVNFTVQNKADEKTIAVTANVTQPLKVNPNKIKMTSGTSQQLVATVASPFKYGDMKWYATDTQLTTGDQLKNVLYGKDSRDKDEKGRIEVVDGSKAQTTGIFTVKGVKTGKAYVYLWVDDTKAGIPYVAECEVEVTAKGQAAMPVASEPSGKSLEKGTKVTLTSSTSGANIYYTTDGSDPKTKGKLYSYALTINDNPTRIKAVAVKDGYDYSDPAEFTYSVYTNKWNDVPESARGLFTSSLDVPSGVWYLFNTGDTYSYFSDGKYNSGKDREGQACTNRTYTGAAITFNNDIRVFYGTKRLWENRDYTLTYANNKAAAEFDKKQNKTNKMIGPMVTVKGMGNYASNEVFYFTISPHDIYCNEVFLASEKLVTLAGGTKLVTVKPVVKFGTTTLKAGTDYDLHYYSLEGGEKEITADSTPKLANYVVEAGKGYRVRIKAHTPGNFYTNYSIPVEVKAVNPKEVIQMNSVTFTIPKRDWTGRTLRAEDLFTESDPKKKAVVRARINGKLTDLEYNKDFFLDTDPIFEEAGTYNVTIVGNEDSATAKFVGTKTAVLTINGIPANKVGIASMGTTAEYNDGQEITLQDLFKKSTFQYSDDSSPSFDPFSGSWEYKNPTSPILYVQKSETRKDSSTKKSVTKKWYHKLTQGTDYDVNLEKTSARGKVWLIFKLKGQYTGEIKKQITVNSYNMKTDAQGKMKIEIKPVTFTKSGATPKVTVKYGDTTLTEGIDYKLSFKNNVKVASSSDKNPPTVTVTGIGNYAGAPTKAFSIAPSSLDTLELVASDIVFSRTAGKFKVVPSIMEGGKKVSIGKNLDIEALEKNPYRYFYASTGEQIPDKAVVPANTMIRVEVDVKVNKEKSAYSGGPSSKTLVGYYRVLDNGKDISKAAVAVRKDLKLYYANGDEIMPPSPGDFTLTMGSGKSKVTLSETDFEIVSVTGNMAPGKATITLRGKGAYGGTKLVTCPVYKKDM